jgi:hypothetical protein
MAERDSKETPEEKGGGTMMGYQQTREKPSKPSKLPRQGSVRQPETDRWGDTEMYGNENQGTGAFTPGELGAPEQEYEPGADNPQGMQTGTGPLGQQGQGNRQENELANLESVEPNIDLGPKDR